MITKEQSDALRTLIINCVRANNDNDLSAIIEHCNLLDKYIHSLTENPSVYYVVRVGSYYLTHADREVCYLAEKQHARKFHSSEIAQEYIAYMSHEENRRDAVVEML